MKRRNAFISLSKEKEWLSMIEEWKGDESKVLKHFPKLCFVNVRTYSDGILSGLYRADLEQFFSACIGPTWSSGRI